MLFYIRKSRTKNNRMNLKPQDILFLLKLIALRKKQWSFNKLALELGMSPSEVHAASKRVAQAGLADWQGKQLRPNVRNLKEFLFHGIQYVFVPERGSLNRGMPTSYATEPLASHFVADNEPPPVWPDPEGNVRGEAFSPLYKSAPKAARKDPALYGLLALVDAVRGGRAREREIAIKELKKRLGSFTGEKKSDVKNNQDKLVVCESIVVSRAALLEVVKRFHIRRLVLFGSAARGELTPESDIDLLVEFEKGKEPSLGGMVEIQDIFAKLFDGRKVDIATPSILNNPYRKQAIEKEMEVLYAA